jgi:sigma-B regulation protein RsbU (phosphoserine phosphatase)
LPETTYTTDRQTIPANSTLYVFSDGIYEGGQAAGCQDWGLEAFVDLLAAFESEPHQAEPTLDGILDQVRRSSGIATFEDDLSILKIKFC